MTKLSVKYAQCSSEVNDLVSIVYIKPSAIYVAQVIVDSENIEASNHDKPVT